MSARPGAISSPQTLSPNVIEADINLVGKLEDIQDDPDNPDANWFTVLSPNKGLATGLEVGFPQPPWFVADLQQMRVLVRKTAKAVDPTVTVAVREEGKEIAQAVPFVVSSKSGVVVSLDWDASLLDDFSGKDVECVVLGRTGSGPQANRASVEIGAIEWIAELAPNATFNEQVGLDAGAALADSAQAVMQGAVSLSAESVLVEGNTAQMEATFDFLGDISTSVDDLGRVTYSHLLLYLARLNVTYQPEVQLDLVVLLLGAVVDLVMVATDSVEHDENLVLVTLVGVGANTLEERQVFEFQLEIPDVQECTLEIPDVQEFKLES